MNQSAVSRQPTPPHHLSRSASTFVVDQHNPLVIANDGEQWNGTFGVVVSALLNDLLPEGSINATLVWRTDENVEQTMTAEVRAFDAKREEITVHGGSVEAFVYLHQLRSITVH